MTEGLGMIPSPAPIDVDVDVTAYTWATTVGLLAILLMCLAVGWAIVYAAKLSQPTMLIVTLSVLSMALIGLYAVFGEDRPELVPLASACIGALVATLASQMSDHRNDKNKLQ